MILKRTILFINKHTILLVPPTVMINDDLWIRLLVLQIVSTNLVESYYTISHSCVKLHTTFLKDNDNTFIKL